MGSRDEAPHVDHAYAVENHARVRAAVPGVNRRELKTGLRLLRERADALDEVTARCPRIRQKDSASTAATSERTAERAVGSAA